jgi:hypothetical protein
MTAEILDSALIERRYSYAGLAQAPSDGTLLAIEIFRRGGRVVDGSGLENRQGASLRGFESHPLRQLPRSSLLKRWRWSLAL